MSEIGTKYVSPNNLEKIIKEAFSNSNPVAILERWFCANGERPDFFDYLSRLSEDTSKWDKGRVFDKTSEIRWERDGDRFHLVWIKDNGKLPDDWNKEIITLIQPERNILLWGERINGKDKWYEKQVPRVFEYPAKGSGSRVYAVLNEYNLEDGSKVYRFKEVIAR